MKLCTKEFQAKPHESLHVHTENALMVARFLTKKYEKVLERFEQILPPSFFISLQKEREELNHFLSEMVQFHDYGKVNPEFQEYIKKENKKHISKEKRKHVIYSFYLWLAEEERKHSHIPLEKRILRISIAFGVIVGHHGSMQELRNRFIDAASKRTNQQHVKHLVNWGVLDHTEYRNLSVLMEKIAKILQKQKELPGANAYILLFTRFVFSILTVSDSVSSSEIAPSEYNEAIENLFCRDIQKTNFHNKFQESTIMQGVERSHITGEESFSDIDSMQDLRILVNKKTARSYEESADIFIIESPVGTGKTFSSLSLADTIINREKKRKIISVFPLNSVQTQYIETLQSSIDLDETMMNVINSESLFKMNQYLTNSNLWLFQRSCFSDELIVTSHVRFFHTFTGVSRKGSLGLLSLIDSVVILDEFQNYPYSYWFGIWGELLRMSEVFGTKWIFTTGTFPVSEKQLQENFGSKIKKAFSKQENEELFSSPFVKDRCKLEQLRDDVYDDVPAIARDIIENIKKQEKKNKTQFLICMNLIKHTKELYGLCKEEERLQDYQLYFLCGRHSSSYKRKLLQIIQEHNKNRKDKILLITTKTVECGMDFDFDVGYKEFDLFDSVEQLSGRVNRSNKREDCSVWTFRLKRRKNEQERLYRYDEEVVSRLKEKKFIELYEDLYRYNKVDMKTKEQRFVYLNQGLCFAEYQKEMILIQNTDYVTEIIWSYKEREENVKEMIRLRSTKGTYSENMQQSLLLRKELEPFRMRVTANWLQRVTENKLLFEKECCGVSYYVVENRDSFESVIERYELFGIISYLENDYM